MKTLKLTGLQTYICTMFENAIVRKGDTISISDEHAAMLNDSGASLVGAGEDPVSPFTEVTLAEGETATHNMMKPGSEDDTADEDTENVDGTPRTKSQRVSRSK